MELEELKQLYDAWINAVASRTHFKKADFYKEDYIFDENMSVKWNKEKVQAENQRMENTNKLDQERVNVFRKKYDEALQHFLLTDDEYGRGQLSEAQLNKIQEFMIDEFDDTMNYRNGFYSTMYTYKNTIRLVLSCISLEMEKKYNE